jgi:hypothetical protein
MTTQRDFEGPGLVFEVKGPDFTVLSDLLVGGKHRDASDGARFERAEEFARLISIENGKAIADVRAEVAYAAEFLRWYAEEAVRVPGGLQAAPSGGEFDSERTVIAAAGLVVCRRVAPAR